MLLKPGRMMFRMLFSAMLIGFLILGFANESRSQLTVTTGSAMSMTPLEFVQTYLVGTGVTVSNATFNGSAEPLNSALRTPPLYRDQIGSFAATGGALTQLGIGGGVILSSGYVAKAIAPANPNDDMEGINQPFESDPDLFILAGETIHDKSILEFDFIPQTDVITFRYVFSSIEFDEFCNSINDAFGLFLSGPGIAGGWGFANNAANIALLPDPEAVSFVTIHNVCLQDNGNLGNGVYSWWNGLHTYFSNDRLTYVLTASHPVTCYETYHMKFAIGDASDGILDSEVFLEQNSFSSNSVIGNTTFSNSLTGQYLVEGCGNVSLVYEIPATHTTALTINLALGSTGTATQADILPNPFPTQVVIPAGALTSPPILIQAISDAIPEPVENLIINATTTTCAVASTVTTTLMIKDYNPLSVTLANQTACSGSPVTLTPVITGGQPILPANTYNYLWSTAATTPAITITPPPGSTPYTVSVTDACSITSSASATANAGAPPVPAGPITGQNTICAPATSVTYTVPAMTGADSYTWTLPAGATITAGSGTNTITVDYSGSAVSGSVTVKGINLICGEGAPVTQFINVYPAPQAAGPITGLNNICTPATGVTYSIAAIPGASSYQWTLPPGATITAGNNTNSITVDYDVTATSGTFTVLGQSVSCGNGQPSSLAVAVHQTPVAAGPITGPGTFCTPATGITYSIPPVAGAGTYLWNLPPGATITAGSGTNSITVDFALMTFSGTISVLGQSSFCGNGPSSSLTLDLSPTPPAAGAISGEYNLCTPVTGSTYSTPAITGANSYLWTIPAGATITAGNNTNAVTVDFDVTASSGQVTVLGHSASCGDGPSSSLALDIHPAPQAATPITGPNTVCIPATGISYSISTVTGADTYLWTLPSGVTITSGSGTNTITVDFSAAAVSGQISVKAHSNSCGDGTTTSMTLTTHPSPEAAGPITGLTPVCQGSTIRTYSIASLAHTTSYDWSVPAGVTIVSGTGTRQIGCLFTTSAVSGTFSVRGFNAECNFGTPAVLPVVVDPIPGIAGAVTGTSPVCQGVTGITYTVNPIANAVNYLWNYSGTGVTLTNNGTTLLVDFSGTATSGNLKVTGQNGCGDGVVSPLLPVIVNPKPIADFLTCNDLKTTKNGRPIVLKGGRPLGNRGVYSGTGVTQPAPGIYVFDPSSSSVSGGSTTTGVNYTITYRYTNTYNCSDEKTAIISVYASNAGDPCPGTVIDCRDNQVYPTFLAGSGAGARCWTAANLNYGEFTDTKLSQTDNCTHEKYCRNNAASQCNLNGGFYQWGEMMQYQDAAGYQDICPPGWHVATSHEWDNLITEYFGNAVAGSSLKDTLTASGFHGRLNGILYLNDLWSFGSGLNKGSLYWTSDSGSATQATSRGLNIFNPSVSLYNSSRANAFPVRCVRN